MTGNKRALGSDLAKIDAHVIQPHEYEELPELTDAWFAEADVYQGGTLVSRGRPKSAAAKEAISIRLSPDVLAGFRARGPGWQTKIDEILRDWLKQNETAA